VDSQIYKRHQEILTNTINEALDIMSPENLISEHVKIENGQLIIDGDPVSIGKSTKIWVFGTGKAAPRMAKELENLLGDRIEDGIIITHDTSQAPANIIQQFQGDHPLPSKDSIAATYELVALAEKPAPGDIVLFCVTGGSSALLSLPGANLEMEDLQETHHLMLNSGAGIHEINTVRKHLSAVKGGQLIPKFEQQKLINLIISDVPGDDPAFIGSGPTVFDDSTFDEAFQILKRFDVWQQLPQAVRTHIAKGMNGELPETVSSKDTDGKPQTYLVGTARKMGETVQQILQREGINVWLAEKAYDENVRKISKKIAADAVSVLKEETPVEKPGGLIYFGESMVEVTGDGLGGRNQELALNVALSIEGQHHISLLSIGTDGRDGPTDAAGAMIHAGTILEARKQELEPETYLQSNDSYHFFEKTGNHIKTGATGNNLMDLQVVLID